MSRSDRGGENLRKPTHSNDAKTPKTPPTTPSTTNFARQLRKNTTDAENHLWSHLRRGQLNGHHFRRQRPIGPYIADFACQNPKLIIELDGSQHAEHPEKDQKKDAYLQTQGYEVLHYDNHTALTNTEAVLEEILNTLQRLGNESPP